MKKVNGAKLITKVLIGSRLHGLNKEDSDYDYRGIFIHPLKKVLCPFDKAETTMWMESDDKDDTMYELRHFCQLAINGNPRILEVLWSDKIIEDSEIAKELRENRHRFLDSERIFEAHKGYANNQYKKMNLFIPDDRTPKFAVAYMRVLIQSIELLSTGDMNPRCERDRDFLMDVKYNFRPEIVPELSKRFSEMQVEVAEVYAKNFNKFNADKDWIRDFVHRTYILQDDNINL